MKDGRIVTPAPWQGGERQRRVVSWKLVNDVTGL